MSAKPSQNELAPPPGALIDPARAHEVLRAWIVGEGLQVSMQPAFEDPAVWAPPWPVPPWRVPPWPVPPWPVPR